MLERVDFMLKISGLDWKKMEYSDTLFGYQLFFVSLYLKSHLVFVLFLLEIEDSTSNQIYNSSILLITSWMSAFRMCE